MVDGKHFVCRTCGYHVAKAYFGQYDTVFPACGRCGLQKGRMDAVEGPVMQDENNNVIPPPSKAEFSTSRYGEGTEEMSFIRSTLSNGPYTQRKYGTIYNARFRCRECFYSCSGIYKGQWRTDFPLCEGKCGPERGQMDAVEWEEGEERTRDMVYISSRFGPGSEVLPRRYIKQETNKIINSDRQAQGHPVSFDDIPAGETIGEGFAHADAIAADNAKEDSRVRLAPGSFYYPSEQAPAAYLAAVLNPANAGQNETRHQQDRNQHPQDQDDYERRTSGNTRSTPSTRKRRRQN